MKLDADTYRHRYGSKGWRDAEARRITREDAAQRGWRRELYDRRFLRWVKPFIERGELPPRSEWPVPFRQRNGIPF
ncbi:hypothetical protein OPIT5_08145 [Opitutaceae bacterium TAV5]|nr:hypothetical protein OPIT5_08145 [Opitutaceae bacterium TAV5]